MYPGLECLKLGVSADYTALADTPARITQASMDRLCGEDGLSNTEAGS